MYMFETPAFPLVNDDGAMDLRLSPKTDDFKMTKVDTSSEEGQTILQQIRQSNFDNNFTDRYWQIQQIEVVHNDRLSKHYDCFKNELKSLGRGDNDLEDVLVFTAKTEKMCKDICREGYKVGLRKRHVLGYTGSGIHLVRNFDILSRYLTYQHYTSPAYILVFKAFLGKAKPIVPRLHKDDDFVAPWTGFDCHTSAREIEPDMHICEALNCSYVYFYEYDDISSNTVKYPRQVLPYAVLHLTKKYSLGTETPFLAVGRREQYSNIEVMGETRRGFRFTYSDSDKRKKQLYTHHKSNKDLVKTSLKEQLLEMRTKGDSKSTPPILRKSVEDVQNCAIYNSADAQKESPVLLKCNVNTFSFNGKTYSLPLKEKDPNRTLQSDYNNYSDNPYSRPNSKASRWTIHRLPLRMKPFVSLKRLHSDLNSFRKKGLITSRKDAVIQKLQVEKDLENETLSEPCVHESDKVTEGTIAMTGDTVVDPCKHELNTNRMVKKSTKDESKEFDKQNKNRLDNLQESASSVKPNGAENISKKTISCSKNDGRQSLTMTDTARDSSQVCKKQACKAESERDKTDASKADLQPGSSKANSSLAARKQVDQLQDSKGRNNTKTFNQELNEKWESQINIASSLNLKNHIQKQNELLPNDVVCEVDKRVRSEIMVSELSACKSVGQRKLESNGTESGLMIEMLSARQTCQSKSVDFSLESDSEKLEFDTACKKDKVCEKSKLNEKWERQLKMASSLNLNNGSQKQNELIPNDVVCEVDKRVRSEIMVSELSACKSVEQRKLESNGTESGLKIETLSARQSCQSKSVDFSFESDSEEPEFDTVCKRGRECDKSKCVTRLSKKSKRKTDGHNTSQGSKKCTDLDRKSVVKKRTKTSNSKISVQSGSRKKTSGRVYTKESASVKDSGMESSEIKKRKKNKSSTCVPLLESGLDLKTSTSPLSLPTSQQTVAKSSTDSLHIQSLVSSVDLECISGTKNSEIENTKVFQSKAKSIALGKSEQPQTVMDVFKEPLCMKLMEGIKSNDLAKNDVLVSCQLGTSTQSTNTNATSPPVGVIAPAQLDFSPTVSEAKTYGLKELQIPDEITSSSLDFIQPNLQRHVSKNIQTRHGIQEDMSTLRTSVKTILTNSMSKTDSKQTPFRTNENQCIMGCNLNEPHSNSSLFRCKSKLTSQCSGLNATKYCDLPNHKSKINKAGIHSTDESDIDFPCAMITSHSVRPQTHQSPIIQTKKAFSAQLSHTQEQSNSADVCHSIDDNMIAPENRLPDREIVSSSFCDSRTLHKNASLTKGSGESTKCIPITSEALNDVADSFDKPLSNPAGNLQSEKCQVPEAICTSGKDLSNKSQMSDTKSNLFIDADIAKKLQRVLRKHISEVQKTFFLSRPAASKTEVIAKREMKHKPVKHNTNSDLTHTPSCLNVFQHDKTTKNENTVAVSNNIDSHEYNLHLLANQSVKDDNTFPKTSETCRNSKLKTLYNCKENHLGTANINASVDVLAEHLNDGSQDTVIGGIRLSPMGQDPLFESTKENQMKESNLSCPSITPKFTEIANDTENTGSRSKYNFVKNDLSKSTSEKVLLDYNQEAEKEENDMMKEVKKDKIQHQYHMVNLSPHIHFDIDAPKFGLGKCITSPPIEGITCSDENKLPPSTQETCIEDGGFEVMLSNKDQIPSDNAIEDTIKDPTNTQKEKVDGNTDHNSLEKVHSRGSRIFGRIHRLRYVDAIENKRSPSSCRNAVIDTFHDLSQTSKAFKNTDLPSSSVTFDPRLNKIKHKSFDTTVEEVLSKPTETSNQYASDTKYIRKTKEDNHLPTVTPKTNQEEESVFIARPKIAEDRELEIDKVIKDEKNFELEECHGDKFTSNEGLSGMNYHGNICEANTEFDDVIGNSKPLQQREHTETQSHIKKEALFLEEFHTSDQEKELSVATYETSKTNLFEIPVNKGIAEGIMSPEAQDSTSICKISSKAQSDNLNTSETVIKETETQLKICPIQTENSKKITTVFARTGKPGQLKRDVDEKMNLFDTKLDIRRMRAKLSKTIINYSKIKNGSMENQEPDSCIQEALEPRPRNLSEPEGNSRVLALGTKNDKSGICNGTEIDCSQNDATFVVAIPEKITTITCQNDGKCTPRKNWTESRRAFVHEPDSKCSEVGLKEKEKSVELKSSITSINDDKYRSLQCNSANEHSFLNDSGRRSRPECLQKIQSRSPTHEQPAPIKVIISEREAKLSKDFGKCGSLGHENEKRIKADEDKNTFEHEIDTKMATEYHIAHSTKNPEHNAKQSHITSLKTKSSGSSSPENEDGEHHTGGSRFSHNSTMSSTDLHSESNFISCQAQAHSNHEKQNNSGGNFKRFPKMHGTTGCYSWRKKYQTSPEMFGPDRQFPTRIGLLHTEEEHNEWKMFKERERIRLQIEQAVKDYRRTFGYTEGDFLGDEKVSKYLQSLSGKLEPIQKKRNLLIQPEQNRRTRCYEDRGRDPELVLKEESTKSFVHRQQDENPIVSRWTGHQKRNEQPHLIQKILQEFFQMQFQKVTEKLRFDLTTKMAKGMQTRPATSEHKVLNEERRFGLSRTVEDKSCMERTCTYQNRPSASAVLHSQERFHSNDYECNNHSFKKSCTSESSQSEKQKLHVQNRSRSKDKYSERSYSSGYHRSIYAEKHKRTYFKCNKRSRSRSVSPYRIHTGKRHEKIERRQYGYATRDRYSRSRSRSSENKRHKSRSPGLRHKRRYSRFHRRSRSRSRSRETPPRKKMRNGSDK